MGCVRLRLVRYRSMRSRMSALGAGFLRCGFAAGLATGFFAGALAASFFVTRLVAMITP